MKRILILVYVLISLNITSSQLSPSAESDISILIDNDYPIITIINPQNTTYNNATPLLVNFTIFDHSLDFIWYSLNNQENITITTPFYLTLAEGNYQLIIYANDSFNRINFSQVFFSVNNSISFCGNNFCDIEESCSSCSIDCGQCAPSPPSAGGETSKGGGGEIILNETKEKERIKGNESNISAPEEKEPIRKGIPKIKTPFTFSQFTIIFIIISIFIIFIIIKIALKVTAKITEAVINRYG